MTQYCDPIDAKIDSDGLQVGSQNVECEVGGFTGRPPTSPQVDVDQPQAVAQLRGSQVLVGLCADGAQDEARRSIAAGRVEEFSPVNRNRFLTVADQANTSVLMDVIKNIFRYPE